MGAGVEIPIHEAIIFDLRNAGADCFLKQDPPCVLFIWICLLGKGCLAVIDQKRFFQDCHQPDTSQISSEQLALHRNGSRADHLIQRYIRSTWALPFWSCRPGRLTAGSPWWTRFFQMHSLTSSTNENIAVKPLRCKDFCAFVC